MIIKATVTDVLRNFSDYVNRVFYRAETFVLVRGGKPVAELSPVPREAPMRDLSAVLASLPRLPEDEARALEHDLARVRSPLQRKRIEGPWGS